MDQRDKAAEYLGDFIISLEKITFKKPNVKLIVPTSESPFRTECHLCTEKTDIDNMISMLMCTHSFCNKCATRYFTTTITEGNINDVNCPFCKLPELQGPNVQADVVVDYFANMDIMLRHIVDEAVHNLFNRKVRDRALAQDADFKWCDQCSSGFYMNPLMNLHECPDCGHEQHRNGQQASGNSFAVSEKLLFSDKQGEFKMNVINCPKCRFKFSLARGGCLHFICTQCKHNFCSGCDKPFNNGAKCLMSQGCAQLGLHAHHTRVCIYYLREKEPTDLQKLLQNNYIPFDQIAHNSMGFGARALARCQMTIQSDVPSGFVDTLCNQNAGHNYAGLCRNHYIEYLCFKIRNENLDCIDIMTNTELERIIEREHIMIPKHLKSGVGYRQKLLQIIDENIPI